MEGLGMGQRLRTVQPGGMAEGPVRSSAMDDVTARVERLIARTNDLAGMLDATGERVLGAEPPAAGNEKEAPGLPGTLGVVFSRLDELERVLERCHRKANRLTQL